ncbi:Hpt domain-containing protein [Endozoicomonas montiporae]|nr:Hpt domain-containing protein [Endozoicomonas montiporae]AMO54639.1 type IV pili sensor histidine kinase and response regulator [Endozoicomonas montiporae CL-33]
MAEQQGYANNNHLENNLPEQDSTGNPVGLDWVKGEISNVLAEARQALEKHLDEPGNPEHLETCLGLASQVHKTLKMLQQGGATLLAEELKKLLEAVSRKGVKDLDDAHECLMQSILQLPGYIEQVVHSGLDRPMPLLPLINEMRSLRGEDTLSRAAFFYPYIPGYPPALSSEQISKLEQSGLSNLLPKIRQKYQVVLAAYLREQQREQQLQFMARIFAKLQNLSWDAPLSPLWEACIALVEGIQSGGIRQTLYITNLLRSVDMQLRAFVANGPSFINTTPDDQLFRGLLYFIAQSDSDGNFGNSLRVRYKLDEALKNSEDSSFIGNEAAIPVIQALNDELAGIKDAFDLYLLATEPDPLILQNQIPIVQQVSDTLSMLGLEEQGQQVRQFRQQLNDLVETGQSSQGHDAETALMTIAAGLLKLETVLNQFVSGQKNDTTPLLNEVFASVIEQARENLKQTKETITEYVDHQFDPAYLQSACDLMRIAHGGLGMTPFTKAANIIRQCADFMMSEWINKKGNLPDKQALENTADVVSAIEYYLDRLTDPGSEHSDAILEMAGESLSKLLIAPSIQDTPEPIENDLSAFANGNLTLVEMEEPEALKPSSKAVFQIDDPLEKLLKPAPEAYLNRQPSGLPDPEQAIEFTSEITLSEPEVKAHELPSPHSPQPGFSPETEPEAEPDLIDDDLLAVFREEADEVQEQLTRLLPEWQQSEDNQTVLTEIRRAFHTLKGSGRMVEASVIGELAWSIENMLNRLIEGTAEFSPDMLNLVFRVNSMLPALLEDYSNNNQLLTPDVLVCMEMADALANGEQYSAPEHPDAPDEDDDDDIAVQFGEVVSSQLSIPESIPESTQDSSPEPADSEQTELSDIDSSEDQLLTVFQTEARDHLKTVEQFIDKVQSTSHHLQISDDVQRAFHTLKGITRMSGFDTLAQLVNALEYHVKEFRVHEIPANEEVTRTLQEGCLLITDALNQLSDNPNELYLDSEGYRSWLDMLHQQLISQPETGQDSPLESTLLPSEGLDVLLLADTYPEHWQHGIDHSQIRQLQDELGTLGHHCREHSLQPVAELSNILKDICHFLDTHTQQLPVPLVAPLQNGFETLLKMLNQIAGQQTPEHPQSVFTELRHALEALLTSAEPHHSVPSETDEQPLNQPSYQLSGQESKDASEFELFELFLEEAFELTEDAHEALESWLKNTAELEPVKELQRLLHSLKGGARMSELPELADLSHALEGFYEFIVASEAAGKTSYDNIPVSLIRASHDHLDQVLQAVQANRPAPAALSYVQKLNEWLEQIQSNQVEPSEQPTTQDVHPLPDYLTRTDQGIVEDLQQDAHVVELQTEISTEDEEPIRLTPDIRIEARLPTTTKLSTPVSQQLQTNREMMRVSAELFEQLINLSGESGINRSRIEQEATEIRHTLDEMETTITRVTEQLKRLDIETQTQILSRHEGDQNAPDFDPLEMDRYSELTQLSRSLMESATDLADLRFAILDRSSETESLLMQQSRTQIQLQDKLMQARMVSFARLLPRLKKITSQVSSELEKPVKLNVQNAEGEMNRTMLDRILAPLEHLIRNAVSHGIESAELRRAAGKPETGQLELIVKREGSDVIVELHDDGAGIDVDAIRTKALEKELIAPEHRLSDTDLIQLILESGFSTAETVTQISGRGVGLDVVNTEIRQMGGSMEIESTRGQGCCFRLRLPFTLSMNRALMVQVGDGLYALPLQSIDGVTTIAPNTLLSCFQNQQPLEYAGEEYQVLFLGQLLGNLEPDIQEGNCPVVLLDRGEQKYALHVDELLGSRDIVVNNLGPQFATLTGVNGATILGDGRVVIIVDPAALIRKFSTQQHSIDLLSHKGLQRSALRKVLIVDDSVTMRKVTSRLLNRQGFDVETARDGVEAMHKLHERQPDILLLDIEMPKMDGFEVATSIRNDERLKDLPIIMITSRTGEKHRSKAAAIGVNEYLGKPFQEVTLLKAIERLIGNDDIQEV